MRLTIILICILAINSQAQSVFRFKGKGRRVHVERTVSVGYNRMELARKILEGQRISRTRTTPQTVTFVAIHREPIRHPSLVAGPNSYLKGLGRRFKGVSGWNKIEQSGGYNGAHHIITKSVIKKLGGSNECINNAPSVFHPLHNNSTFEQTFHNHEKQLEIYNQKGIRGIMEQFFEEINEVNKALGIPPYRRELQYKLFLEAQLWSEHWGFRWE